MSSHALSAEDRVLLLCLQIDLAPADKEALGEAIQGVNDWEGVARRTIPHRIPMLVHHHVISNFRDKVPRTFIEKMRDQAIWQTKSCLKIIAAQNKLVENVLDKCDAPYVFFKGFSIGEQLYPDPCLRFCRDIDIWVDPDHIKEFWRIAQTAGYIRLERKDNTHHIPIKYIASFVPTLELLSPEGDVIEIHFRYDHSGLTVDPRRIFQRSVLVDTRIGQIRIPSFEDHFAYICQHHTRHLWARLRWLVDLDAFRRSPKFDRQKILQAVEGSELQPTVTACLELADDFFSRSDGGIDKRGLSPETQDLYRWILRALQGGPEANHKAQILAESPDFPLRWQYGRRHLLQVRSELLKPTFADYLFLPLKRNRWWLYYLLRPVRLVGSLFRRRAPKAAGSE